MLNDMANDNLPKIIFLVSGKRKSGKDYISNLLLKRIGEENAVIIRLSAPIKSHWAKVNNLELGELLGSSEYKENYRKAMIEWGENIRCNDYGYFCNAAIEMTKDTEKKPLWIISDVRRKTDLKWFNENYSNVIKQTVRVTASDEIRQERGWTFVKGVDDAESECDLDSVDNWDIIISTNNIDDFDQQFKILIDIYKSSLEAAR